MAPPLESDPAARYAESLSAYLTRRYGAPTRVGGLRRVTGGFARATWRCDIETPGSRQGAILRVMGGPALNLSELNRETDAQAFAHDLGAPVPKPLLFEADPDWLGGPFALIEEVAGGHCTLSGRDLEPALRETLGHDMWTILGHLAAAPIDKHTVPATLDGGDPRDSAAEQLAEWTQTYRDHEIHPHPVADAAIRWLQRHLPPAAALVGLVHGDYRLGNLLHDGRGTVIAVVDWEMAHLGDPLEDLAWSLDARQDANFPEHAAGLISYADAVAAWQEASQIEIDGDALRWWQVMCAFKALGIWTLAGSHFTRGDPKRPADARMGWVLAERQHRILADLLSPDSRHVYYRYGQ
ncbi:phosphotransferase family protein [Streptomyces malaysiensis]|uniref:phosphotransferase family protein n=1 Tax=Streptomyces malaysiensis TaxID=92644 RepID=UPI002B2E6FD2|nr:phosphotransferase family protein [Streptomyces malaysiensis]